MAFSEESALGGSEFERPDGVVHILEVGTAGEEFVDDIFNADAAVLLEVVFNNHVVGQGNSGLVDLQESALVNQVFDGLLGGETISDIGFHSAEHVHSGAVDTDQSGVVDLSETEESEDLSHIGVQFVDTKN